MRKPKKVFCHPGREHSAHNLCSTCAVYFRMLRKTGMSIKDFHEMIKLRIKYRKNKALKYFKRKLKESSPQ